MQWAAVGLLPAVGGEGKTARAFRRRRNVQTRRRVKGGEVLIHVCVGGCAEGGE